MCASSAMANISATGGVLTLQYRKRLDFLKIASMWLQSEALVRPDLLVMTDEAQFCCEACSKYTLWTMANHPNVAGPGKPPPYPSQWAWWQARTSLYWPKKSATVHIRLTAARSSTLSCNVAHPSRLYDIMMTEWRCFFHFFSRALNLASAHPHNAINE